MAEAGVGSILRESLPLLLLMALLEVIAGSFLGRMEHSLERLPGLLALLPAVLAMRGNISTSLGSRLGTATRFGLIPRDRWLSPVVWHNLVASLVLGLILAAVAAVAAHTTSVALGLPSAGILRLGAIAMIAGLASGVLMAGAAILVMRGAFRRGYDLDNVAGPVLMTLSDLSTLACLWLAAAAFGGV
ncbi:MAG: magnesium transporter [Thermoplasmatota archaeon]